MSILPLQLARVSNLLRSSIGSQQIARTQRELLDTQNQLATGRRLNAPSDDPGDAAIVQQLQKTLEQRQGYADNLQQAAGHLGAVDGTLGDLADLLRQAQTIASANVGSDVTPEARLGAAEIVKSLYSQLLTLANKQHEGVYLFAGDRATAAPFVEAGGGVKYVGSPTVLSNTVDQGTKLAFMVDGEAVFGALSSRMQGTADLTPRLGTDTRLADLGGVGAAGVRPGIVQISNGTTTATVDLSRADTVGDVIDSLQGALPGIAVTYGADNQSLVISGGATDDLTITDVGGGTLAADLGIVRTAGAGPGAPIGGGNVGPKVTLLTRLTDLRGSSAAPIDFNGGITITNGQMSQTVGFAGCTTVEDVLNTINGSGLGVRAEINAEGTGLNILNPTQGTELRISEGTGTTAAALGLRSFNQADELSGLNYGRGVHAAGDGERIRIALADGSAVTVDVTNLSTVPQVITAINAAAGSAIAALNPAGDGIQLTDPTVGPGTLGVTAVGASRAVTDLGLDLAAIGNTLVGGTATPMRSGGDFQVSRADGTTFNVDVSQATTIAQVIAAINAAAGAAVADFNPTGNGIRIQDNTFGAGTLRVTAVNYSLAAHDLGLDVAASGGTIVGRDVHPVRADGVFHHLAQLRDALQSSDAGQITAAAEGLQADYDRVVRMRGQAGARVQEVEARQDRLADENVATEALLSQLADTDFAGAVTRFQTLQTALQATLQTTARVGDLSLLDFLG